MQENPLRDAHEFKRFKETSEQYRSYETRQEKYKFQIILNISNWILDYRIMLLCPNIGFHMKMIYWYLDLNLIQLAQLQFRREL